LLIMLLQSVLSLSPKLGFIWLRLSGLNKITPRTSLVTAMADPMIQKPKIKLLRQSKKSKIGFINKIKSYLALYRTKIKMKDPLKK
jgi:hypothetical protein